MEIYLSYSIEWEYPERASKTNRKLITEAQTIPKGEGQRKRIQNHIHKTLIRITEIKSHQLFFIDEKTDNHRN